MDKKAPVKTVKKKRKIKPIYKPYLKGRPFSKLVVKRGLKLLMYAGIFLLLNLFFGTVFSFDNVPFLRIVMNMGILVMYGLVLYHDGIGTGDGDVAFAEIQYDHQQAGETVGEAERARCYHPLKGVLTVLTGLLPLIVVCVIYAFVTKRNTYALQALPSWTSAFSAQEDFAAPLAYYYRAPEFGFAEVLRLIVRLMIYPFYNLVGPRNADAVLLTDRLSALLLLLPFMAYAAGYLMGPRSRALVHGGIASARRRRKRASAPAAKKKQPAKPKTKELV